MSELIQLAREIHELCALPAEPAPRSVHRFAVIGAGTMGRGIAAACLPLGEVLLVDPDDVARAEAGATIRQALRRDVRAGVLSPGGMRRRLRRLRIEAAWPPGSSAELIVESVPEDLELKRKVLSMHERHLVAEGVWASNTSALAIVDIAEAAERPGRVLGMHYFLPVERSRLVELIASVWTDAAAAATARAVGVLQGKAVLQARDSVGFFTTRLLSAYFGEGLLLLHEGWPVPAVDAAAAGAGFEAGPFELLDLIGLEVAARVAARVAGRDEYAGTAEPLHRLVAAGARGKRNGTGFYRYDDRGRRLGVNPSLDVAGRAPGTLRSGIERLLLVVLNESARALQKRVVRSAAEANVGAVLGVGFPAATGGPLRLAARHPELVGRLQALATVHGPRFRPAAILPPSSVPA